MFKIIFVTVLFVGAICLPQTKQSNKYPKKYDKEIHGTNETKGESSYLNYTSSGQTEEMDPPEIAELQEANYDLLSDLPQEQGDYNINLETINPPPEDTYASYNGDAIFSLVPPQEDGQTDDSYFGYVEGLGEMSDILRAPELSSYVEMQSQYNDDPQSYSDGLSLPPLRDDANVVPESSYLSFDPSLSSYNSHDNTKDIDMQPPPSSS